MPLQFLEFDLSDDGDGGFSASALACPAPQHTPALIAEVQALLQALHSALGAPGALDEGHRWDLDLQTDSEDGQALAWADLSTQAPSCRISLSLHLAGGEDLRQLLDNWTPA